MRPSALLAAALCCAPALAAGPAGSGTSLRTDIPLMAPQAKLAARITSGHAFHVAGIATAEIPREGSEPVVTLLAADDTLVLPSSPPSVDLPAEVDGMRDDAREPAPGSLPAAAFAAVPSRVPETHVWLMLGIGLPCLALARAARGRPRGVRLG